MNKASFRDILAEFLDESDTNTPSETSTMGTGKSVSPEPTPLLYWVNPDLRSKKKNGYPPPPNRKFSVVQADESQGATNPTTPPKAATAPMIAAPPKTAVPPKPAEKVYALKELADLDQDAVETLLRLGAVELKLEISMSRVKKAHRRLAKALHPDRIMRTLSANEKMKRQEQFLMLQAAYEFLSRSLRAKEASGSTSGNGSASESDSPHQDAA